MAASRFATAAVVAGILFLAFVLFYSFAKSIPDDFPWIVRAVLGCLIGLLILSLKLPANYRVNLVLMCASGGIALLVVESILEFTTWADTEVSRRAAAARKAGVDFDGRTGLQVTNDLRNEGLEIYPRVAGMPGMQLNGEDIYPLAEVALSPVVVCNEFGKWMVYQSDEHGFNNPLGIWGRDSIQIVSIGDSFTYGVCVEPERNAPALVRAVYEDSLNLGVPSTGSLAHLAVMKEYLGELKPRVVLWFYWEGNDLTDLRYESQPGEFLRKYLEGDFRQNLVSKQGDLDKVALQFSAQLSGRPPAKPRRFSDSLRHLVLGSNVRTMLTTWIYRTKGCEASVERSNVPDTDTLKMFERVVVDANQHVASWGGRIYFVYLPAWVRYGDPVLYCGYRPSPINSHDQVLSIVNSVGLPIIDVSKRFDAHSDPKSLFVYGLSSHYNNEGYKLVADTVLESIQVDQ